MRENTRLQQILKQSSKYEESMLGSVLWVSSDMKSRETVEAKSDFNVKQPDHTVFHSHRNTRDWDHPLQLHF